jgi:uncharacterized protein (DUF4415 family)
MSIVRISSENMPAITPERQAELRMLAKLSDDEIDFSDDPATGPDFWKDAVFTPAPQGRKLPVTLRLDADVLAWFKAQGAGYTTLMAMALRYYAEHARR